MGRYNPMKILLVNPPIPKNYYNREFYPPPSLLYLGAVLKRHGDEVKILDFKVSQKNNDPADDFYHVKLIETILDFSPDLVGFGCLFSGNFSDILELSRTVKNKFPELPIVIGGIHPTIFAREILSNCPTIDWIILSEGEDSIIQLIEALNKKIDFDDIDGFAHRDHGQIIIHPKKNFIKNLDQIPFPAYDLIRLDDYYIDTSKWHNPRNLPIRTSLPIISSRSCPRRCPFCSMWAVMGPSWRARSAKNVVDEIEYLCKTYDHHHFSFMDDNMTLDRQRTLDICNGIISRGLHIQFETPNGLAMNTLDKEVLDALVKAGLVRVSLAIESGSDYIRNTVMRKGLSQEKIYEVIKIAKEYPDLYIKLFFVLGMPEDTKETLMDTYHMIKELKADRVYLNNLIPFPGTSVFEQALKDNLFVNVDIEDLYKSRSFFPANKDNFFIKTYTLGVDELKEFRIKCENPLQEQKSGNI